MADDRQARARCGGRLRRLSDRAAALCRDLARRAERAKLDFVFKADYLVAHPALLKRSRGLSIDPTLLLSVISQQTEKIGLVTTISTSFMPPYILARQLQSLQWLSNGRVGWNIVTSIDGFENFGYVERPTSDMRYETAKEAVTIVKKLWNSYTFDGTFTPVNYQGAHFSVNGALNVAAHPSGGMPLFQAGASETGRDFAAQTADAIFAATPNIENAIELSRNLRKLAVSHGRKKEDIRILPGCYLFVAPTREEAEQMYMSAHRHIGEKERHAKIEELLGMSLERFTLSDRITPDMLPPLCHDVRSLTHSKLLRDFIEKSEPTVQDILNRPEVIHSAHWVVYGNPEEVAEEIIRWHESEAIDGLIAIPGGPPKSAALFLEGVIPLLQERGLFREDYDGNNLRDHLQI